MGHVLLGERRCVQFNEAPAVFTNGQIPGGEGGEGGKGEGRRRRGRGGKRMRKGKKERNQTEGV